MASCQSVTSLLIKVGEIYAEQVQDFRSDAAKVFADYILPANPMRKSNWTN